MPAFGGGGAPKALLAHTASKQLPGREPKGVGGARGKCETSRASQHALGLLGWGGGGCRVGDKGVGLRV